MAQNILKTNYADQDYAFNLDSNIMVEEPEGRYYSKNEYPFQEEAYKIIGACMEVHKVLGKGFLESVYHEALCIELTKRGIPFELNKVLRVFYKDEPLKKTFTPDIFAYKAIIVELKAIEGSLDSHSAQVINYLAASKFGFALLFNFGTSTLQYRRIILSKNLRNK